jgi:hypothetical protein
LTISASLDLPLRQHIKVRSQISQQPRKKIPVSERKTSPIANEPGSSSPPRKKVRKSQLSGPTILSQSSAGEPEGPFEKDSSLGKKSTMQLMIQPLNQFKAERDVRDVTRLKDYTFHLFTRSMMSRN